MPTAAYDEIADWYEREFLPRERNGDPIGVNRILRTLLGRGTGVCLEIGCGTGVRAPIARELGWRPVGVDISAAIDGHWTTESWTDLGVRDKVGATHYPLPDLLHAFLAAGLAPERFEEGGEPTPVVLAVRARRR